MIKDNTAEGKPRHKKSLMDGNPYILQHKSLLKITKINFATKRLKELSESALRVVSGNSFHQTFFVAAVVKNNGFSINILMTVVNLSVTFSVK